MSKRDRKMKWHEKQIKKMGYKGCRNCNHQIAPLRGCEWMERGGDGVFNWICPKWEKRGKKNEIKI